MMIIKSTKALLTKRNLLPLRLFSTKRQTKAHNDKPTIKKQPQRQQAKLRNLQTLISQFVNKFESFAEATKQSPLNYTALFCRSCLISSQLLEYDRYYPIIKSAINRQNSELTPHSCTALIQCFSQLKFQGDENKIISKLCQYYEDNHKLFTQSQQIVFWENYMKIMSQKVHSTVKFYNLKRQARDTLEFSTLKDIFMKIVRDIDINKKIVDRITYENYDTQVSLFLNHPKIKDKKFMIRFKPLFDLDEFDAEQIEVEVNSQMHRYIFSQINSINSKLKKKWRIYLFGKTAKPSPEIKKQTVIYTSKSIDNIEKIGYAKPQIVQQITEISEQILNSNDKSQLLMSNRYINGIFYSSPNPNNRKVDFVATLVLAAIDQQRVRYKQKGQQKERSSWIAKNFMSVNQLKECYDYSKMCQFHWQLFQAYIELQTVINYQRNQSKFEKYGFNQVSSQIQQKDLTKEQAIKALLQKSQQIAELTAKKVNNVENVEFEYKYNKDYKQNRLSMGNYSQQLFWQMRPMMADSLSIMDELQQLATKYPSQNSIKVMVVADKRDLLYLIKNILSFKYWTVPKFNESNPELLKLKEQIIQKLQVPTQYKS